MPRVISYNVAYTTGMDGSILGYSKVWRNIFPSPKIDSGIIDVLVEYQPDILGLLEVDSGSIRARRKSEAKSFSQKLNYKGIIEVCKYDPHSVMGVLSKLPIFKFQTNALIARYDLYDVKYHWLSHGVKRLVIQASFNCPHKVTLFVVHLALGKGIRKKQFEELAVILKGVHSPMIVMGDMNTFDGHGELHGLIARTDLVRGPTLKSDPTFPSYKPEKVLDYILTTKEIEVTRYEVLPVAFSDHLPVLMDFTVKKQQNLKLQRSRLKSVQS